MFITLPLGPALSTDLCYDARTSAIPLFNLKHAALVRAYFKTTM